MDIYNLIIEGDTTDYRYTLQNYKNIPWAKKHFEEFGELIPKYQDFIVRRSLFFKGHTININEKGVRDTPSSNKNSGTTVWMFGGSTMWGTGSDDLNTIPSILARIKENNITNYGESGYIIRQSINLLMNELQISIPPKFVIYYDGVNDVASKCRKDTSAFSSIYEPQILEKMTRPPQEPLLSK